MKTHLTHLLTPLAAMHAAERATFVRESRMIIQHGMHDGRYFIRPGMFVIKDGSVLMAAPWGRPPSPLWFFTQMKKICTWTFDILDSSNS